VKLKSHKYTTPPDMLLLQPFARFFVCAETLKRKFPQEKYDFTKIFPRVLTLYIFSYLDPRTLCRCAQVGCLLMLCGILLNICSIFFSFCSLRFFMLL